MTVWATFRNTSNTRAIHIINSFTNEMCHQNSLYVAQIDSLASRRKQLARKLFPTSTSAYFSSSFLDSFLRDPRLLARIRDASNIHAFPHAPKNFWRNLPLSIKLRFSTLIALLVFNFSYYILEQCRCLCLGYYTVLCLQYIVLNRHCMFKMKFFKKTTFYWLLLTFRLRLEPSSERSV